MPNTEREPELTQPELITRARGVERARGRVEKMLRNPGGWNWRGLELSTRLTPETLVDRALRLEVAVERMHTVTIPRLEVSRRKTAVAIAEQTEGRETPEGQTISKSYADGHLKTEGFLRAMSAVQRLYEAPDDDPSVMQFNLPNGKTVSIRGETSIAVLEMLLKENQDRPTEMQKIADGVWPGEVFDLCSEKLPRIRNSLNRSLRNRGYEIVSYVSPDSQEGRAWTIMPVDQPGMKNLDDLAKALGCPLQTPEEKNAFGARVWRARQALSDISIFVGGQKNKSSMKDEDYQRLLEKMREDNSGKKRLPRLKTTKDVIARLGKRIDLATFSEHLHEAMAVNPDIKPERGDHNKHCFDKKSFEALIETLKRLQPNLFAPKEGYKRLTDLCLALRLKQDKSSMQLIARQVRQTILRHPEIKIVRHGNTYYFDDENFKRLVEVLKKRRTRKREVHKEPAAIEHDTPTVSKPVVIFESPKAACFAPEAQTPLFPDAQRRIEEEIKATDEQIKRRIAESSPSSTLENWYQEKQDEIAIRLTQRAISCLYANGTLKKFLESEEDARKLLEESCKSAGIKLSKLYNLEEETAGGFITRAVLESTARALWKEEPSGMELPIVRNFRILQNRTDRTQWSLMKIADELCRIFQLQRTDYDYIFQQNEE